MSILLFLLWLILNGRVTVEIVAIGILCVAAVYFFAFKVIGYTPKTDLLILHNLPWVLLYLKNLLVEVVKAAWMVMQLALTNKEKPDPFIVEFHSGLKSELCNVILANSITLTPGTITLFQQGDFFVIHCLRREYGADLAESSFIKLLGRLSGENGQPGNQSRQEETASSFAGKKGIDWKGKLPRIHLPKIPGRKRS